MKTVYLKRSKGFCIMAYCGPKWKSNNIWDCHLFMHINKCERKHDISKMTGKEAMSSQMQTYKFGQEVEIVKLIKEMRQILFLWQTAGCSRVERPIIDYFPISISICPLFLQRKEHDFMVLCLCLCECPSVFPLEKFNLRMSCVSHLLISLSAASGVRNYSP